ncbi:hypothetical protein [Anaeromicropila herbilytica]|uniref:Uncharacterized protein n=1 Tax=Anaeromicropila herbilytica TaxID=2785025 RepID=A0A7R7IDW7_9FIRM|nr:hypothetical protein [Anaeromicropila herbilytica]BCN31504.1 hypothetical protein bsdtb5_27990 [Anaeromicropila herbilytica]
MPITQLDMISMAPRSQEASQYKHIETTKLAAEQNQISTQFNQEIKHNSQQTTKTNKTENNEYRYDAKEKGNSTYYNQNDNKKKKKSETKKEEDKQIKLSNFDIKI